MSAYIFAVMWFAIAAYLFYFALTEDTFFFAIAPFFVFLGLWVLLDELTPANLMAGPFVWIYRGVAAVMHIICGIKYILYRRNR